METVSNEYLLKVKYLEWYFLLLTVLSELKQFDASSY